MRLSEFRRTVDLIDDQCPEYDDPEVTVVISEACLGSTPSSRVKKIYAGFDWDKWQVMIKTEDRLFKNNKTIYAHWIYKGEDKGYFCSNCGSGCLLNYESDYHQSDYCPHCGAKMSKENENEAN